MASTVENKRKMPKKGKNTKPRKYYAQCGNHKRVLSAKNEFEAAKLFLRQVLDELLLEKMAGGNDQVDLGIFIFLSEAGFLEDVNVAGTGKQVRESYMTLTSQILDELSEVSLAEELKKMEYSEDDFGEIDAQIMQIIDALNEMDKNNE